MTNNNRKARGRRDWGLWRWTAVCLHTLTFECVLVSVRHVDSDLRQLSSRVVMTRYGSLRGFISNLSNRQLHPVEVFLGVPYAGAPKGPLRFMPPVTSPHWKGVRLADQMGPVCPQKLPDVANETEALKKMPLGRYRYLKRLLPQLANQSEDCLYLNIYIPATVIRATEKLPVMVYIHGESYEWNAGNPYDGRVLASFGNVIVITINYRLGVLGFLPAVDRSARGNYGLMDQVAALHWIQDNIGEFGGDTDNITIFGQGHGAACVNLLMLSPMARGLFQRAIMQSGSSLSSWAIARDAITHTAHIAKVLDCPAQDSTALVECMRKKKLEDIMGVHIQVPDHLSGFGPTVDGIVLPQDPAEIMEKNPSIFTQYDLIFGITRVESYFEFSAMEEKLGIDSGRRDRLLRTLVRNLYTYHLQEIFLTVVNEYMNWSRSFLQAMDIFDSTVEALGDALIVAPVIRAGTFHSGGIPREDTYPPPSEPLNDGKKTYFYIFNHQSEFGDYSSRLGCVRGEDLPYVFGAPLVESLSHFAANYTKSETSLSEAIITFWTNFARHGNPALSPHSRDAHLDSSTAKYFKNAWPLYEPVQQKYISISMKTRIRDHYHAHRLSYWLNLIPRLHDSGDGNASIQHHRLHDHDNPYSYDGVVRHRDNSDSLHPALTTPFPEEKEGTQIVEPQPTHESFFPKNVSISVKIDTEVVTVSEKLTPGNITQVSGNQQTVYSTALVVTIAVGCSLLVLNVLIFAGIYYQKEKDSLEKKLQKTYYEERRNEEDDGHPSGEKPFLVKDLSSSMMLSQYCPQTEFDGSQTLDLVQPSKAKHQYPASDLA
ncbi:neuroligin-4, X-linked-like isoform X3 [Stegodyphus dumicola]|uniref:neuroligin-4, X-linked-like isoform X3 n=1 Tax=Stegodyphus dumicola TaxID=202533 RepID=UPI0015B2DA7A|nr:neuroligin-4, X-linked-like isoform X3 [Stegodyphus dumicola]